MDISLRRAGPQDCQLLFEWRNLPEIVHLSSSRRRVNHNEHNNWFASALSDRTKILFIIEKGGFPVGQIRFEINCAKEAEISAYLIPGQSGRGVGVVAIDMACNLLFQQTKVEIIIANIRDDNRKSIAAFSKCGFKNGAAQAAPARHLLLTKSKTAD